MSFLKLNKMLNKKSKSKNSGTVEDSSTVPPKPLKEVPRTLDFHCEEDAKFQPNTVILTNSYAKLVNFDVLTVNKIAKVLTYFDEEAHQFKIGLLRSLKYAFRAKKSGSISKYMWGAMQKAKCNDIDDYLKKQKNLLKWTEARINVCLLDNTCSFPTGLLSRVEVELGITLNKVDKRQKPENGIILRWKNKPFDMRYYQKEAAAKFLEAGRGVLEMSVGSGKSLVAIYIVKEISAKTLIVVPSSNLKIQLYQEFELAFGAQRVQMVESADIKKGKSLKDIRVMTIQTLASLQKQGLLQEVTGDIDVLILDEFHHCASTNFTNMLPEIQNIYYKLGLTGTFTRNDSKILELHGFLSDRLYHYPAWKATKENFLTPVNYYVYNLNGTKASTYQKEYAENYCGSKELLVWIQKLLTEVIPKGEQILILVDQKEKAGKVIHKFLNKLKIKNTYVSGDNKSQETKDAIASFNSMDINILVSTGVLGEGIDLKSAQHLILACGGKSEIKLVQAIGRLVRLFEGKAKSFVYDCVFQDTKYLEKHGPVREDVFNNYFSGKITHF